MTERPIARTKLAMARCSAPSIMKLVVFVVSGMSTVACMTGTAHAQTIGSIREAFRDDLSRVSFGKSLTGLIVLSNELELSGSRIDFDDDGDTAITAFALPFGRTFQPWGDEAAGLYVEGAVGFAVAEQSTDDFFEGQAPGFETTIDTDWMSFSVIAGVGPSFEVAEGLRLAPVASVGLTYLRNETDYGGPGAAVTEAIADGLAFNWDALAVVSGIAGRAEYQRDLAEGYDLTLLARYDMRWTDTIREDDPAQRFFDRTQIATLRADVTGPMSWKPFDRDLRWRLFTGYRHFIEGDLFDAESYAQFGGGFEVDNALPLGTKLTALGSVIVGDDLLGFTAGLGIGF